MDFSARAGFRRQAIWGLGGAFLLAAAVRRENQCNRVDRAMTIPAPRTDQGRYAWRAVTGLGSRPVAYAAVTARCLLPAREPASAAARWWPLAVLASGDLARTALCRTVGRARPPAADWLAPAKGASFPSRHAATALLVVRLAGGSRRSAACVAGAVGLSRSALRVHWPTDIAGGWLFGYGWFAVAAAVKRASRPPSR